jgi:hypothetical protein
MGHLRHYLLKNIYSKGQLRRIPGNYDKATSLEKTFGAMLGLKGIVLEPGAMPRKVLSEKQTIQSFAWLAPWAIAFRMCDYHALTESFRALDTLMPAQLLSATANSFPSDLFVAIAKATVYPHFSQLLERKGISREALHFELCLPDQREGIRVALEAHGVPYFFCCTYFVRNRGLGTMIHKSHMQNAMEFH